MGRDRLATVADQTPERGGKRPETTPDQRGLSGCRGGRAFGEDVIDLDGLLPARGVDAPQQQIGNDATLRHHQPASAEVGLIASGIEHLGLVSLGL